MIMMDSSSQKMSDQTKINLTLGKEKQFKKRVSMAQKTREMMKRNQGNATVAIKSKTKSRKTLRELLTSVLPRWTFLRSAQDRY